MLFTHESESVPAFTEEEQQEAVNLGAVAEHSFFSNNQFPDSPLQVSLNYNDEAL